MLGAGREDLQLTGLKTFRRDTPFCVARGEFLRWRSLFRAEAYIAARRVNAEVKQIV